MRGRLVRVAAWSAFALVALEVGSAVVLSVRARRIAWPGLTASEARARARPREVAGPGTSGSERLHPYVGYLPPPSPRLAMPDGAWLNEPALFAQDSPVFHPTADVLVVAVTGGSVAGQLLQNARETLALRLADVPRFAGRRPWFVGLAFGGWKEPQQLAAVTWLLALGGHLDVVLNLDGFNEVALHASENGPKGVAPSFPRAWAFRVAEDEGLMARLGELAVLQRERAALAERALASPLFPSFTYRLWWKLADRRLDGLARAVDRDLREAPSTGGDAGALGPRVLPPGRALDELAAVWSNASRQLSALAAANGFEYLHALQPNQYLDGTKPLSDEERARFLNPDHPYGREVRAGYAALARVAASFARDGVPFADLTHVFAEAPQTLYADDCCHLNAEGYRLLAEALVAALAGR